jgi:hypothetical protein
MRKLADSFSALRKKANIPASLERGLLARARTLKRRERDRIKAGAITEERAEREAERAALAEFLETVTKDLESLNG